MLLFEWYNSFDPVNGPGNYSKWFDIGKGYAQRYGAGGDLAREHNLGNYGVTLFTACNEPEGTGLSKAWYHNMLEGLADGVHSVNATFRVNPGGFKNANAFSDFTLDGFGSAIADLWNNAKLDGIDLHTYTDVEYAPISGTYKHSAQDNFDQIHIACKITRDVNFYSTEFNFKKRVINETTAAQGLLADIWDNLGVVNNAGKPCTKLALIWNLYDLDTNDEPYGIAKQLQPVWIGTERGKTLQMVLAITAGMEFESADPKRSGEFVLVGRNKKLWVWQNRAQWTNHEESWYLVRNIPTGASKLVVYNWAGSLAEIQLNGASVYNVTKLETEQTYMFLSLM